MRTNVQCLPEYQLDVGRVVVVVVVVRRGWIGGKSDAIHRGMDRSSSDKKGREGRKKDKGRIFRFGFRLVGRSTLNAMTRARVTREKARQGGGEERGRGHRAASLFIGGPAKTRTMNGGARSAFSERGTD